MENIDDLFQDFDERDEMLRSITRYSLYKTMLYRTNLLNHSRRMYDMMDTVSPFIKSVIPKFDSDKAKVLCLVHDDPEIFMGDIQAGNKAKMTPEQLEEVRRLEDTAIEKVSELFPEMVGPYLYKELLVCAHKKDTIEAMVMDYIDKFDAFGEALHELFAGNKVFITHVVNEYGKTPVPSEHYPPYLANFPTRFPPAQPLFRPVHELFEKPEEIDFGKVVETSTPYTKEKLFIKTGYKPYDTWRGVILPRMNDEELRELYVQKEFLS